MGCAAAYVGNVTPPQSQQTQAKQAAKEIAIGSPTDLPSLSRNLLQDLICKVSLLPACTYDVHSAAVLALILQSP